MSGNKKIILSKDLQRALVSAEQMAIDLYGHKELTVEHVLQAMMDSEDLEPFFAQMYTDKARAVNYLDSYLKSLPSSQYDKIDKAAFDQGFMTMIYVLAQNYGYDAEDPNAEKNAKEIGCIDFLEQIFKLEKHMPIAAAAMYNVGVDLLHVEQFKKDGKIDPDTLYTPPQDDEPFEARDDAEDYDGSIVPVDKSNPNNIKIGKTLKQFSRYINQMVKDEELDPIIGRDNEIDEALKTMARRTKSNPVLVGEAGVGKTAIVYGIAQRIVRGENLPDHMKSYNIFEVDLAGMVAGTKYRGEFEQRLKTLVADVQKFEAAYGPTYIVLDELHTIIGAGGAEGAMDAANILKPMLADGRLKCIGSTTLDEYRKKIEKDGAMDRRFTKVDVPEPSVEETHEILKGVLPKFEKHHNVAYDADAVEEAAKLAKAHLHYRHLPDSAFDLVDKAGSHVNFARTEEENKKVTVADIRAVVAKMTKIPLQDLSKSEKERLRDLDETLKTVVFNQDHAVDEVVRLVKRSFAGTRDKNRPMCSLMLPGPTGVGKTELAKQTAIKLGIPLKRLDMSEFMEKHNVSRLTGSTSGYVGYEEGGELTNYVKNNPHCVLLFDEIEKAHKDVQNILLQIMDRGKLTDGQGNMVDFSNVIVLMTTNVGATSRQKMEFGGVQNEETLKWEGQEALNKLFTPEFRGRLDGVVPFNYLSKDTMVPIVHKNIQLLAERIADQKITIELDDAAVQYLSDEGFEPKYGARPLRNVIEREVEDALAEEILFGKLQGGGHVKISFNKAAKGVGGKKGKLKFSYSAAKKVAEQEKAEEFAKKEKKPKGPGGPSPE